ncbi:MAG: glycosyltransferase family 39 protein [Planctomycetes bacterium]|nr:glycosyltransferase family 39 protein [Planctomycetota bacterium]
MRDRWPLAWAAAVLGLLVPSFAYDLRLPDEPRVAHTALEMARTGDLVVPAVNGRPFLQTPPLHYWVLAAWLRAAGREPDGIARIPSVLFAAGTIAAAALIARRALGERAAVLAVLILSTTFGFWDAGHRAVVDTSLAFFVVAAFVPLSAAWLDGGLPPLRAALLGASAGLAYLAKGLPWAGVIAVAALHALLRGRGAGTRSAPWARRLLPSAAAALGAFLLAAGPWTAALWARDPAACSELLLGHVSRRFLEGAHHDASSLDFVHRGLVKLLPWAAVLPFALLHALRAARGRAPPAGRLPARVAEGLLVWAAVPVALLLVSRSKRSLYLLPVYPAVALLAAAWLDGLLARARRERLALGLLAALLVLVPAGGTAYNAFADRDGSLAALGRAATAHAAEGGEPVGLLLEEREEAAVAWYLGRPFESFASAADLAARLEALGARAVVLGDGRDLGALGPGEGPGGRPARRLVLEHKLRRRTLELWAPGTPSTPRLPGQ